MSFAIFVGWVLAGLLAGVLASLVANRGYGLKIDVYLGLAGAIAGSWALRAIGLAPGNGVAVGAIVAFRLRGPFDISNRVDELLDRRAMLCHRGSGD